MQKSMGKISITEIIRFWKRQMMEINIEEIFFDDFKGI